MNKRITARWEAGSVGRRGTSQVLSAGYLQAAEGLVVCNLPGKPRPPGTLKVQRRSSFSAAELMQYRRPVGSPVREHVLKVRVAFRAPDLRPRREEAAILESTALFTIVAIFAILRAPVSYI